MFHDPYLNDEEAIVEVVLSPNEEHFFRLLIDMGQEIVWVNRTRKGIVPGALETIKMYYSDMEATHILESLVRKGMLDRISNGIVLLCPSCGSFEASILQSCPACESVQLNQKNKIVHMECDHWGTFEEFQQGNQIKCPLCEEEVPVDELLSKGSGFNYSDPYYECQKCGFTSNRVLNKYLCNKCKTPYDQSKAMLLEQTGYKITADPCERPEKELPVKPRLEEPESPLNEEATSEEDPDEEIIVELPEESLQELVVVECESPPRPLLDKLEQAVKELGQRQAALSVHEEEDQEEVEIKEIEQEEDMCKVLLIVEDHMFYNLIIESLSNSGDPLEVTYVDDGAYAMKSLRKMYDLIILDTELSTVDPVNLLREMEKWKIKTPLIVLDNGYLGKTVWNLNTVAVLKRKQREIEGITQLVSEIL